SKGSSEKFVNWLTGHANDPVLTKTPVFWSGKIVMEGNVFTAESYAKAFALVPNISKLGTSEEVTIINVIKKAGFEEASQKWKAPKDWGKVSKVLCVMSNVTEDYLLVLSTRSAYAKYLD
ncbi:hypothetical protein H0H87_002504, partial [Tephrocybe sp. NHM501043]